ncbi:MAG: TIGR03619 family F420-dependent LLM class oxidoreductase [Candidatus Caldarchaeum sp.]|nr:TIGR03619 family F420-dependent LLM class oxidoreductase [Candidatus Caldarchaeum sp.]
MRYRATFGVVLPDYCGGTWKGGYMSNEELATYCREVERLGYTSIWHAEHYVMAPPLLSTSWYDPLVTLAVAASATKKVKIGTAIIILPLRNPGVLAKEAATLDVLSDGRLILGVAIGWLDKEFELVGVSLKERGRRFEESIKVMKLLWTMDSASWEGRFWRFKDIKLEPKPLQKPHPPLIIGAGGRSMNDTVRFEKLLRRAAELGDGWYAATYMPAEFIRKSVELLSSHLKTVKKDVENFPMMAHKYVYLLDGNESKAAEEVSQVLAMPLDEAKKQYFICDKAELAKRIHEHISAGLTHFNIIPLTKDLDVVEYVANEIAPKYV